VAVAAFGGERETGGTKVEGEKGKAKKGKNSPKAKKEGQK